MRSVLQSAFILILALWIAIMAHKCMGCKATFSNKRALSAHRVQCSQYPKHGLRPTLPPQPTVEVENAVPNVPQEEIPARNDDELEISDTRHGDDIIEVGNTAVDRVSL